MQRGSWLKWHRLQPVWADPGKRIALMLAVLTFAAWLLLLGNPNFTNASHPRYGDPVLSMKFVSSVEDVDLILGEEPSVDRETMRMKVRVDYAFIGCYSLLLLVVGVIVMRTGGWRTIAGGVISICGAGAGVFDILENRAILEVLDTPLKFTTPGMLNAIRGPAMANLSLIGVALALLISHKVLRKP